VIPTIDALNLVIDRSDSSKLEQDLIKRRLKKALRKGKLIDVVDNPDWKNRLATARLMLGDYGWTDWEHRSVWAQMCWLNEREFGIPRWRGEEGKILLLGEQGIGDEIMFSQYMPKNAELICEERLVPVFERNFGIKCYPRDVGKELTLAKKLISNETFKYYCAIADIPRITGSVGDGRAYFRPDPDRLPEMEPYRGQVGISWRGRNGQYKLSDFPSGLSLQYDIHWDEDALTPHIDVKDDIEGIIALVSVLKKVVTVSTTVAHIAGSLGVPTEVILAPWETGTSNNMINFRWGMKRTVPWYKSVRVFRNMNEWKQYNI
jgi:hypothetical protein